MPVLLPDVDLLGSSVSACGLPSWLQGLVIPGARLCRTWDQGLEKQVGSEGVGIQGAAWLCQGRGRGFEPAFFGWIALTSSIFSSLKPRAGLDDLEALPLTAQDLTF